MEHCLLCHKEGHIAFCCDSSRARIVDETITYWMGARLYNLYQTNDREDLSQSSRFERLSAGDLLFLLREFIDDKNKMEFARIYNKNQLICFLLAYETRRFLRENIANISENVKKRISIDIRYWIARAKMTVEDAQRLRILDIIGPLVPSDCGICLRDGISRCEMISFACTHSFCQICVDRIMTMPETTERKCPYCREHILHTIRRTDSDYIYQ